MTTVIRDTIIATCDPDGRILYDGAIAIDDNGIIAAVGPSDEVVRAYPTAETISARGKAVYPGFFNCHTHLTATLSRGILEDLGFPSPLRFPEQIAAMLSAEEMQVMALLGAIEAFAAAPQRSLSRDAAYPTMLNSSPTQARDLCSQNL